MLTKITRKINWIIAKEHAKQQTIVYHAPVQVDPCLSNAASSQAPSSQTDYSFENHQTYSMDDDFDF